MLWYVFKQFFHFDIVKCKTNNKLESKFGLSQWTTLNFKLSFNKVTNTTSLGNFTPFLRAIHISGNALLKYWFLYICMSFPIYASLKACIWRCVLKKCTNENVSEERKCLNIFAHSKRKKIHHESKICIKMGIIFFRYWCWCKGSIFDK